MITHNLGYPRIGENRELKKVCEKYWAGKINLDEMINTGKMIRKYNWLLQKTAGLNLIPSNDFSFYDHVLDMTLSAGAIPQRYNDILNDKKNSKYDLYFAMARGYQRDDLDIIAMEMTKWFDTNYHYIVPEFTRNQKFSFFSRKIIDEFIEAKELGIITKPVLLGPVSYLLLGKEKQNGFNRVELIENLLPVYKEIFNGLKELGAEWIQLDEPYLIMDLNDVQREALTYSYSEIGKEFPSLKIILASYFGKINGNLELASSLPVYALHIDLIRAPEQLDEVLNIIPSNKYLSLGLVDGRNVWKNDFQKSLNMINRTIEKTGTERIMIAPSCSLLHSPCNLDSEDNGNNLMPEVKQWLAFAKQKIDEVVTLNKLANHLEDKKSLEESRKNKNAFESRKFSKLIHKEVIKQRVKNLTAKDTERNNIFNIRKQKQQNEFHFPLFPTTTIGSFPQTEEIRKLRAKYKKGELSLKEYEDNIKTGIEKVIKWQEDIKLDVLVHGEFERNDMVEYFGEQLDGFVFTKNGWVQSYGSRCVKPPVIFGDVERPGNMTVKWSKFAQSKTSKPVKGMLTGPVTILQWSFVRDDQPRSETAMQIALAIRDEVSALENAGIKIIQIDEPAFREGLPLSKSGRKSYLDWAVKAFRIASGGVKDETQIHTHMCYSEFNDIIDSIADMDADVITIENSRSQTELLDAFINYRYPNDIGPGVYDIHSPRIPSTAEMIKLIEKASAVLPKENIWVNPDCGLKTRGWKETEISLKNMVEAATVMRKKFDRNLK